MKMKMQAELRLEMTLDQVRDRVAAIELVPPAELDQQVVARGYKGQEGARHALVLACYRHVRRLRRLFVDGIDARQLGPRQNLLLVGPTGSGKTFLIETLFRDLVGVPSIIVDATTLTETGYIGTDVSEIPARLIEVAEGDLIWAQTGVICLDEFDKLAATRSNVRFGGAGTTKDLRLGVQRGLLALLSGESANYVTEYRAPPRFLMLSGITVIGCGAFSDLRDVSAIARPPVGFGHERTILPSEATTEIEPSEIEGLGFLPELVGRFSRIVQFDSLSRETLRAILVDSIMRSYRDEFAHEGITLQVESGVVDQIVAEAVRRGHGARGLHATLAGIIEEAAFRHFGFRRRGSVVLRLSEGLVVAESCEEGKRKASLG